MAGRIQGITVEIGGDTTKLQTALKGVEIVVSLSAAFFIEIVHAILSEEGKL